MEINPMSGVSPMVPFDPTFKPQQDAAARQVVAAVQALNKSELFGENRQLQFSWDKDTNRMIVKIMNPKTGETIDQIPPATVLGMLAELPANPGTGASVL